MDKILEGIPVLGWGRGIECTFFGSLDAALRFLKEPVNYTYLMGVSAAAFRLRFHYPEWCASSPDAALDGTFSEAAMNAIGYKGDFIVRIIEGKRAAEKMFQIIKEEINEGRPLLAIGITRIPDWGIIAGYGEDGKIICRTYYDKGENYSIAEAFPWILFRIKKEKRKKPSQKEAFLNSIKLAVELAHVKRVDHYFNGLAAYDVWIADLKNEEKFEKMNKSEFFVHWHINGWIYNSLYDARNAAVKYLKNSVKILEGNKSEKIREAAEKFEKVRETLFNNWVFFTMPHWVKGENTWTPKQIINANTWTPEMREKGAKALEKVKTLETEAFEALEKIIA